MSGLDYKIPNDGDVSPTDIQPEADLSGADLSEANLRDAKLRKANLNGADLSGADLLGAELPKANLDGADLSGAELGGANLSEAKLRSTNLSEARLQSADLTGAFLVETTLDSVKLNRLTKIDLPGKETKSTWGEEYDIPKKFRNDIIARANHELREAYSGNGFLTRARTARVQERHMRRLEAKDEGGFRGFLAWLGSRLSSVFTGYGVRLSPVVGWMVLLYLSSAFVYWHCGGMAWERSLYYSVVTFTTSPPNTPPPGLPSVVAGIETFAGTAAVVFLGYVLGSRERI